MMRAATKQHTHAAPMAPHGHGGAQGSPNTTTTLRMTPVGLMVLLAVVVVGGWVVAPLVAAACELCGHGAAWCGVAYLELMLN